MYKKYARGTRDGLGSPTKYLGLRIECFLFHDSDKYATHVPSGSIATAAFQIPSYQSNSAPVNHMNSKERWHSALEHLTNELPMAYVRILTILVSGSMLQHRLARGMKKAIHTE